MHLWELISIVGIAFLILEMFTPSLFFLNFALSAFLTALLSVYIKAWFVLVLVFFVLSFVSFIFLRPILVKKFSKENATGVESKYIGKVAIAEEDITDMNGVIMIYGERWDARSENGKLIPKGKEVKVIRNESIIMYVEEIVKE